MLSRKQRTILRQISNCNIHKRKCYQKNGTGEAVLHRGSRDVGFGPNSSMMATSRFDSCIRLSSPSSLPSFSLRFFWTGGSQRARLSSFTRTRPSYCSSPRFNSSVRTLSAFPSTLPQSSLPSSPTISTYPMYLPKRSFHSTLPSHKSDEEQDKSNKSSSTTTTTTQTSDPPILTWYDPYTPAWMGPYLRLARVDKPIGTWLLLWPCLWSTAMASSSLIPDPHLCTLFAVGSFVMRGSGCTINDLWDQDFDKQVTRTKARPLASGELTTTQGIQFLGLQLLVGLGVLTSLPHMEYCFLWGVSSLPLVVVYPLMKRFSNFPQVVLGLTFNWGAWMGWAATYGSMNYAVIAPLYLSGVCWTVVYDTIYANQDKDDDKAIGLKSTALTFGEDEMRHKQILHGFAALTFVQWLAAGYMMEDISMIPYGLGMSAAYSHLLWQIQTAELDNPQNLADRFRSNTLVGGIVFASIVAGKVL